MSTIAIVGAGPGLGAAVAERFGRAGFAVALVARHRDKLAPIVDGLAARGTKARAYQADVRDRPALTAALSAAASELGPIEVLQYSPVPGADLLRPVLETSADILASAVELSILGAATAIQQVLPGMRQRGHGTILLVNGSSAATPNTGIAGTSVAFAGESAYGAMLHDALASDNIHVAQLIIPRAIGGGDLLHAPEALAERLWTVHRWRGPYRTTVGHPVVHPQLSAS